MPTLLLIRHGENDFLKKGRLPGRLPGIHLNARGLEQAAALAESLGKMSIQAVYSSPLERAAETAQPLAEALGLEVQPRPGLLDGDVGSWQGKSLKSLGRKPIWKLVQRSPSLVRFPEGESFLEVQARIVGDLQEICTAHKPKDLLAVVFHADPIKLAISHYLGLPLDHFQKLGIGPGSVSILHVSPGGAYLTALNLTPPFSFKQR
jgi:probable phosphomutase (TIGR03848 family)